MKLRRLCAMAIAMMLLLSTILPTPAAAQEPGELVRRMLNYYYYHQESAAADIACLNEQLAAADPVLAEKWENIFAYWTWINHEKETIPDILPDGLPGDESLCIVVLGYGLKSNGDMQDELIGRLEVALASAEKYPNAYIACTGGGTASRKPDATEADRMAQWLLEHGIPEARIIIENQSRNTSQNAQFTLEILASRYPCVKSLAIITSDYHLPRGCLLFYTQAQLSAGEPLEIVSRAAYEAEHKGTESMNLLASSVASLAGVSIADMPEPKLSRLTGIAVAGPDEYDWGSLPALTVTAHYDSGLSRDVTDEAVLTGFSSDIPGNHTIAVSFQEFTEEMDILVHPAPTEAAVPPPAAAPPETVPQAPEDFTGPRHSILIPAALWIVLFAALVILIHAKKSRRK